MKNFRWQIYCGSKYIDGGDIEAKDERDGIVKVMALKGEMDSDKSYSVTVGDTSMSSFGDEFKSSARAAGWGADDDIGEGPHIFRRSAEDVIKGAIKELTKGLITRELKKLTKATVKTSKSLGKLGASVMNIADCQGHMSGSHDMNDTVVNPTTGENHAKCRHCGFIDNQSLGTIGAGTDRFYGTAQESASANQSIYVTTSVSTTVACTAGGTIEKNDPLRLGADGRVYLFPPNKVSVTVKMVPACPDDPHGFHTWVSQPGSVEQLCNCGATRDHPQAKTPIGLPLGGVGDPLSDALIEDRHGLRHG